MCQVYDCDFDTIQMGCLLELSFQPSFPDGSWFFRTSLGLKTNQSILSQMEVADGPLPQRYWTLTLLTLSYLVLALNRRQPLFLHFLS